VVATHDRQLTALLVIDPYNDFISEGGRVWDRLKPLAEANGCVPHMLQVLTAARKAGLRVFYAPHRRYRPGDYETWKTIAPTQQRAWSTKASSGFANTDLDLQLKKHGIHRLIAIGLLANTCLESTVRFAAELGYDVTVVRDATAALSQEQMHAAIDVNLPHYANAIMIASEVVEALSSL